MIGTQKQLDLFQSTSCNTTYEVKRQIRLALAESTLSRDEVVDEMNRIAVSEGMRQQKSKTSLDNWVKDSAPDRLPPIPWMTILCHVLKTVAPIAAMMQPLGAGVIGPDDVKLLKWARAERDKKLAAKRARLAEQALEV